MKALTRPAPPHPFACAITKQGYYADLFDGKGDVKPRWNDRHGGTQPVRDALADMSNDCCAYCGKKVKRSDMEVDHFLPKGKTYAPYLAYCWENLLPSCRTCNNTRKGTFFPKSLQGQMIIDTCAHGLVQHHHLYDQTTILALSNQDRLLDPAFDHPIDQHLTFDPEFHSYHAHSTMGEITIDRFFAHKEFEEDLEEISNLAKQLVVNGNPPSMIQSLAAFAGYEFFLLAYYDYWCQEQAADRMR